jgi:hypothetical protein
MNSAISTGGRQPTETEMLWLLCAAVIIGIGAYLFERWEGENQ